MKLSLKSLLLLTVLFALLSCSTSKREVMVGAYGSFTALTAEDDSLFRAVMVSHQEWKLRPVKVAHQVVAGTNHRFLCRDEKKKRVEVVIYEPLPGQGMPRLLSVDGKAVK